MWVTELAGRLARSICRITVTAIRSSQASRVFLRRDSCERRIHQKGRLQLNEGQIEKKKTRLKKKKKEMNKSQMLLGIPCKCHISLNIPFPIPKASRFCSVLPALSQHQRLLGVARGDKGFVLFCFVWHSSFLNPAHK